MIRVNARKSSRIHAMLTGYHTMKEKRHGESEDEREKSQRPNFPFISAVINVITTLSSSRSAFENKIIKYYLCGSYLFYRKNVFVVLR